MGTRFNLVLTNTGKEAGEEVFNEVRQELNRIENKLSYFRQDSIISHINNLASEKPLLVDKETFTILEDCKGFFMATQGTFDISVRPLLEYLRKGNVNLELLDKIRKNVGFDKIYLDADQQSVSLKNSIIKLDLGGYGKGYALFRINNILEQHGFANGLVSFGDSSILAKGHHPHGGHWPIGISNPFDTTQNLYSFNLKDQSLSVSGNTLNQGVSDKSHIIRTEEGQLNLETVLYAVSSPSATEAEVLSTALMASNEDQLKALLTAFPDCRAIKINFDNNQAHRIDNLK